ncbi:hypothetical protein HXX76_004607 [Chlamydomonas incerta]|uniref:Myb-like domain-containing protein n=1 Tax=Chlamydomonas incerta TaxID=51695 RepID=A0A835T882_CHLIN|nr:hypothetical protein HXX76_004607 [Chlamydomonas incerta]|eukprot:KAG2439246.1 hypothetical protein HXX76_004607 [Chlamydomonas incerta]
MGRWRRHLDPNIRKDAWSAEEDALLQRLYEELGTAWSCISKQIANRTPQQCRGRWCILSGLGKNKMPSPAAPQTPHPERGRPRKSTGAVAVAAFPSARHAQQQPPQQQPAGQACPSSSTRRGAVTELPALPASACAPGLCEAPTVQQARRTRAAARVSAAAGLESLSAGDGEEPGAAAGGALAPATQPRLARQRTRLGVGRQAEGDAVAEKLAEQEDRGQQHGPEEDEEQPAPSGTEDETESQEVHDESDGQEDGVDGNARARRGRLVLGRRLVSFRTGPRTTARRPSSRLTATATMIASPGARAASGAARSAANRVSAAAAAVALLSPPRGALALALCDDDEEEAMLSGLLDDEDDLPPPPLREAPPTAANAQRSQAEAGNDQVLHTPTADEQPLRAQQPPTEPSADAVVAVAVEDAAADRLCDGSAAGLATGPATAPCRGGHRRAASQPESRVSNRTASGVSLWAAEADAEVLDDTSTRKTRSGRVYHLPSTSSTTTSVCGSQRRRNRPSPAGPPDTAATSTKDEAPSVTPTADTALPASDAAAAAAGAGPSTAAVLGAPPTTAIRAPRQPAAHLSGGQAVASPRPMLSEDEGDAAEVPPDAAVHAAEQQAHAPAPAPLPALEAAGVAPELLQNLNSPPPLQVVGRLLTAGSSRSSFGLPEALLGADGVGGAAVAGHAASPGVDLPAADWNVVGSPPTSSLLALLQAGLLQTPTGTPGASPGPSILNAPVPQDMPQITPGVSNQWSDVQAVSWSEWRNINAGFGVLSRAPGLACGSAAGTPDNTRTLARTGSVAEGTRGVGFTPRRDMFVRPQGCQGAAAAGGSPRPPPLHVGPSGSADCDADSEGHGGTRSLLTSPSGSVSRVRRSAHRRASADEAVLDREMRLRLATAGHDLGVAAAAGAVAGPSRPNSARGHPGLSPSAGLRTSPAVARTTCELVQEAALPDFCSPSKRQRMATSEPGNVAVPPLQQQQQAGPGHTSIAVPPLGGLSSTGAFGARLPPAPRFGTSMPGSIFGAAGKQAGLLDNLTNGNRCGRDGAAAPMSLLARLQAVEQAMSGAATASATQAPASSNLPAGLLRALEGTSPHPTMAPPLTAPMPVLRPLPPVPFVPIPPGLARALMPPPSSRARPASGGHAPVPAHAQLSQPGASGSTTVPIACAAGVSPTFSTPVMAPEVAGQAAPHGCSAGVSGVGLGALPCFAGGLPKAPAGLPPLMLPKLPSADAAGGRQHGMASFFPVLSLASQQQLKADKENVAAHQLQQ